MRPSFVLDEMQVTRFIAAVANLYGCRLVDIDFARRIVNISGDRRAVTECINELHRVIGENDATPFSPVTYQLN
jgi:hypothetical protein